MDCLNHPGVSAAAYCQNCGKALCQACVRREGGGQVLCEPCWMAWQSVRAPFVAPPAGGPSPGAAAVLGLIPGVGAMYNGQFFKGFIHVVIFAVLVSMAQYYGIFGIFIAAWILYQSFEAYHTARARRDGEPLPDPLGLNEVGNWLNLGGRPHSGAPPTAGPAPQPQAPPAASYAPPYQAPYSNPYQAGYRPPPFAAPPAAGFTPGMPPVPPVPPVEYGVPPVPPVPPVPSVQWRRREPIAAIILIGLGILFLLGQFDLLSGRVFEFAWPVLLIGLGAWLFVRRMNDSPQFPPAAPPPEPPKNSEGDLK